MNELISQAYVDVHEEGTEAAAAIAVVAPMMAAPSGSPLVFRVDHPFLFLIRENKSGTLLFLGKVIDPTWAGQ